MPRIPYPDVPDLPGVPTLARLPGADIDTTNVLSALRSGSALSALQGIVTVAWGVYWPDGRLAIQADSVIAFSYDNGSVISDYPVEGGQFYTYNRVSTPYSVRVTFAKGFGLPSVRVGRDGGNAGVQTQVGTREDFLRAFDRLLRPAQEDPGLPVVDSSALNRATEAGSVPDGMQQVPSGTFVDVVTPDAVYAGVQLVRYNYARSNANGVRLIRVEAEFREIRTVEKPAPPATAQPDGAAILNRGYAVPVRPTPEQFSSLRPIP